MTTHRHTNKHIALRYFLKIIFLDLNDLEMLRYKQFGGNSPIIILPNTTYVKVKNASF